MITKLNFKTKVYELATSPIKRISNLFKNSLSTDVFESSTIDIHSKSPFPSCVLSNFHKSKFTLDRIKINSMEGFLQSLKTSDINIQKKVCKLVGKEAKNAGNILKQQGYDGHTLFWNGKEINRFSDEYQELLKRAYDAKFRQDLLFRKALKATEGKTLIHSIGSQKEQETILTEKEFIGLLNNLRGRL